MPTSASTNPELTAPVDLSLNGRDLNPAARGWSRTPLHRTTLRGWGRNKAWDYWGLVSPDYIVGVTVSNLDYAAVLQGYLLDRRSGKDREFGALIPFGGGVTLPDTLPPMTVTASGKGFTYQFADQAGGTALHVEFEDVVIDAVAAEAGDSLSVVVPWSRRRFQYTVKDLARPLTGALQIGNDSYEFPAGESFAVLDRGRGRWPYAMTWNWAAGSGSVAGERRAIQLGGQWTVGTGATENALFVGERMHYIPTEVTWDYTPGNWSAAWRMHGERVDAEFIPEHVRHAKTNALVIASETFQAFGTWRGWAETDAGERIDLTGLTGWAEQAQNRW